MMLGHVIWYITYHRCMVMSNDTSHTIDVWSYHIINHLMSMGFTFHTIHHLSSRHILLHLPSMHGHVLWYITFHHAWSCLVIHHPPSMHGNIIWYITSYRCKIMSFDTSTIIDAWSCHLMQHLRSCHVMHHLQSIHRHVIWYVTYF